MNPSIQTTPFLLFDQWVKKQLQSGDLDDIERADLLTAGCVFRKYKNEQRKEGQAFWRGIVADENQPQRFRELIAEFFLTR